MKIVLIERAFAPTSTTRAKPGLAADLQRPLVASVGTCLSPGFCLNAGWACRSRCFYWHAATHICSQVTCGYSRAPMAELSSCHRDCVADMPRRCASWPWKEKAPPAYAFGSVTDGETEVQQRRVQSQPKSIPVPEWGTWDESAGLGRRWLPPPGTPFAGLGGK